MDDSFSFSSGHRKWQKESYFSPLPTRRKDEDEGITHNYRHNGGHRGTPPTTSKIATAMETLCSAMESRDLDSVSQLLFDLDEAGEELDVNQVVSGYSMSLLHLSVGFSNNSPLMVDMMLRHGGDPNNMNIEEQLSPLHLSAIYDHDRVMKLLVNFGGDPKLRAGDGKSCYDIVKRNVEDEMLEKCFSYLFTQNRDFRKSMGVGLAVPATPLLCRKQASQDSGSDGFYSCDSQSMLGESDANSVNYDSTGGKDDRLHSTARRLFPKEYADLMTEDESLDSSDDDDGRRKLTTIPEESGLGASPFRASIPESRTPTPTQFPPAFPATFKGRGIASMTAPIYLLTDDTISITSETSASCINSTPPITPQPTKAELEKLQERMKQLKIPVTPSTFNVISKFAESDSRLQNLMTPKQGSCNFSSELQAGLENLNLIYDWGNRKIDYLQNATPTANVSKSFYNYLLLDPKIIKRANFSGDSLKAGVINSAEKFEKFLLSVFYIGKAHGKRPLQHLDEAKAKYVEIGKKPLKNGEKIDKILQIWRAGMGVMIVSVFHHSSEREANVNEACMIDAMGLVELSNLKKGSYMGTGASGWSQKMKNQLGSFLLHKSYSSFVVSDPKQFYPHDIS